MRKDVISKAVGEIEECYVREAAEFYGMDGAEKGDAGKGIKTGSFRQGRSRTGHKRMYHIPKMAAAAIACLLVGIGAASALFVAGRLPFFDAVARHLALEKHTVKAYAYGSGKELTEVGAIMDSGSINDERVQKGHPLMFYLSGEEIHSVRFSCQRQQLSFVDWTEQREEYGLVQNFTVPYGENEEEYSYLVIYWEPNGILEALEEKKAIAALPEELREDRIVMEVTLDGGSKVTKTIQISLLDDGNFFAVFDDYTIREEDAFVRRPDDKSLRELSEEKLAELEEGKQESEGQWESEGQRARWQKIEAAKEAALAYYEETVFEIVSLEVKSQEEGKVVFSVRAKKGGILQEPDRGITVELRDGSWEVTGEGY